MWCPDEGSTKGFVFTVMSLCFQVFVFDVGGKTWKSYNWSMVTTVATFGKYDAELMCYAHSKGARVVLKGTVHLSMVATVENVQRYGQF